MTDQKVAAAQGVEMLHLELGSDLCRAVELLNHKLQYEFEMPRGRQGEVSRKYAELREARLLICQLKYSDSLDGIAADELAWALKLARDICQAENQRECLDIFDRAGEILGIELAREQHLPADLAKKIGNELQMMAAAGAEALVPVAA